jgi:hypothetical protein
MKYLVQLEGTPEAGLRMEARPGGPGPIVARIIERFAPEAVYMSPGRRTVILVCDLTHADMTELMIAGSHISGRQPEFIPVVDAKEFGAIAARAMPAAQQLIDG